VRTLDAGKFRHGLCETGCAVLSKGRQTYSVRSWSGSPPNKRSISFHPISFEHAIVVPCSSRRLGWRPPGSVWRTLCIAHRSSCTPNRPGVSLASGISVVTTARRKPKQIPWSANIPPVIAPQPAIHGDGHAQNLLIIAKVVSTMPHTPSPAAWCQLDGNQALLVYPLAVVSSSGKKRLRLHEIVIHAEPPKQRRRRCAAEGSIAVPRGEKPVLSPLEQPTWL
jgi:hypothetical protein